jgi:ribonucleoside-diphosphate reductase alpha chain
MGATHAEKSTSKAGALNAVSSSGAQFSNAADTTEAAAAADPKFCSIDNPECEACQ